MGFLAPAGTVAVALIALVVGINSLGETGSDDSGEIRGPGDPRARRRSAAERRLRRRRPSRSLPPTTRSSRERGATPRSPPPPSPRSPPTGEQLKPGEERIQEKTVSTTLSADPDEVAEVADGVVEVTERYDGIVAESNVNTSGDRARATFDLRIPTQNLQAFLADLSDLASVTARNEGSLDITAPFVSAEERFDEAKAEVDSLVSQLAEADSPEEMADDQGRPRARPAPP